MRLLLLQCVARAAVRHGGRFLLNLAPGGEVLYDIAADAWEDYRRAGQTDALRAELEALAQAPPAVVRRAVADTVREAAADRPATVREALAAYLGQVPAAVRRSLRRPSDPGGTTAPAGLALRRPEDLVHFLPARPPRFKPGDRPLPGVDWELEELVGVGGFGEVWRARHAYMQSKPPVALKFCLDASAVAALRNEAGVLDRVMQHGRHLGIVPLLHTYLSADPPCLEYEFVEGGDLASLIQEMHARGRVKPEVANRVLLRLAEIVAFAHGAAPPIVHSDLKPANVLVRRLADGRIALKVTDFGIGGLAAARAADPVRQSSRGHRELLTEAVRGAYTPLYASPQQMARRPGERADPRDDVHALGVIWFQLLTGNLQMTSIPTDWPEQLKEAGLGADLIRLLGACVAPKAEKRPLTAAVLVEQIAAAKLPMAELAPPEAPVTPKPRPRPPAPVKPPRPRPLSPRPKPAPGAAAGTQPRPRRAFSCVGCLVLGLGGLVVAFLAAAVCDTPLDKVRSFFVQGDAKPQDTVKEVKFSPPLGARAGAVVTNPLGMKFAWCPPGKFTMGSPPGEEGRADDEAQHEVKVTTAYYMSVYPVTQPQWQAVMGANPSSTKGDDHPVETVTWFDCEEFCRKLSQRDRWLYRLPTEEEWEYACRAGTSTAYYTGADLNALKRAGWCSYDGKRGSATATKPVGQFEPNAWGFYDMHGNVYQPTRAVGVPPDPKDGSLMMSLRGGSYNVEPALCRAAARWLLPTGTAKEAKVWANFGCRVVLEPH